MRQDCVQKKKKTLLKRDFLVVIDSLQTVIRIIKWRIYSALQCFCKRCCNLVKLFTNKIKRATLNVYFCYRYQLEHSNSNISQVSHLQVQMLTFMSANAFKRG